MDGSDRGLICIGIVDHKYNRLDDEYCTTQDYELHAMEAGVDYLIKFTRYKSSKKDIPPFKQGDILQKKLNMKQQTFTFKINDQNPPFIFRNVAKSGSLHYRLAVTMRRLQTSATIVGFEVVDDGDEEEQERKEKEQVVKSDHGKSELLDRCERLQNEMLNKLAVIERQEKELEAKENTIIQLNQEKQSALKYKIDFENLEIKYNELNAKFEALQV